MTLMSRIHLVVEYRSQALLSVGSSGLVIRLVGHYLVKDLLESQDEATDNFARVLFQ